MTAPDFRPFEQKFKGKRHLGPAQFLRSEEGGEWDEGSESESESKSKNKNENEGESDSESESESESEDDDDDEYSEPETPGSKKRKRAASRPTQISRTIYIDQVMERARL